MVTSGSPHYGYWGLSTETKPGGEDVQNGAAFTEIDTGKNFLYDKENDTWYEQPSGGGGGGSALEDVTDQAITLVNGVDINKVKAYKLGNLLFISAIFNPINSSIGGNSDLLHINQGYGPKVYEQTGFGFRNFNVSMVTPNSSNESYNVKYIQIKKETNYYSVHNLYAISSGYGFSFDFWYEIDE